LVRLAWGSQTDGTLYVADTLNNRIAAIPHALTRQTTGFTGVDVSFNGALSAPLGLVIAPNGHIITANGVVMGTSSRLRPPARRSW
jgi:sugar lactone lactonase YvrE